MSAEAEVSEATSKPVDQNAEAADEAKKMLEELSGESKTNGTAGPKSDEKPEEKGSNGVVEGDHKEEKSDDKSARSPERRRGGRGDRGDRGEFRGRGRGREGGRGRGGFDGQRTHRNNIKSDVTTQEESKDPVAIRKQVC